MQRIFIASLIASLFGPLSSCGSHEATKSPMLANTSSTDPIELDAVDADSVHTAASVREIRNTTANCQTAAKIKAHLAVTTPETVCVHKVTNPSIALVSRNPITRFYQLAPNLQIAFLNTQKKYKDAQASCAKLGEGWHAPRSNSPYADPQATDNSNSLEAVSDYLRDLGDYYFWSSSASTQMRTDEFAFATSFLWQDMPPPYNSHKEDTNGVLCVKP